MSKPARPKEFPLAVLFALVCLSAVHAQTASPSPQLSIDEALRLANAQASTFQSAVINERIAGWRFDYPGPRDHEEHRAVTEAANYLRQHPVRFPEGRVPSRPSEIAVLAVKSYRVFLDRPKTDAETSAAIVAACRDFDRGAST